MKNHVKFAAGSKAERTVTSEVRIFLWRPYPTPFYPLPYPRSCSDRSRWPLHKICSVFVCTNIKLAGCNIAQAASSAVKLFKQMPKTSHSFSVLFPANGIIVRQVNLPRKPPYCLHTNACRTNKVFLCKRKLAKSGNDDSYFRNRTERGLEDSEVYLVHSFDVDNSEEPCSQHALSEQIRYDISYFIYHMQ